MESNDIIDIGVNLAHRSFNADREAVIKRAFAAGVKQMIITGTSAGLRRLAALDEVVAIGECGLGFNWDFSPRQMQEKWFEVQVALAEVKCVS